jgi:hypothetical protein
VHPADAVASSIVDHDQRLVPALRAGFGHEVGAVRVRPMSPFRGVAAGESVGKVRLAPPAHALSSGERVLCQGPVAPVRDASLARRGSGTTTDLSLGFRCWDSHTARCATSMRRLALRLVGPLKGSSLERGAESNAVRGRAGRNSFAIGVGNLKESRN